MELLAKTVNRNLAPAKLYQESLLHDQDAAISSAGSLIAFSGEKTGRSPGDKRVVQNPESTDNIWWGNINIPFTQDSHDKNKSVAIDFLNKAEQLYVMDGFAGWDPEYRIKVRVITTRPYHALFMNNMLIRPTADELANFGEPDYIVYNAGQQAADQSVEGVDTNASVSLSFEKEEIVILGTEYAGEMKKGVFTIMNYLMPLKGEMPMHCSVTSEIGSDKSAILFGLSGTGKTTLSADPKRNLIGDDEHVWT